MMKIILDVDGEFSPRNDEIIVYNASKKAWELTSKHVFLSKTLEYVAAVSAELNARIDEVKAMAENNGANIKKIADVVKENL